MPELIGQKVSHTAFGPGEVTALEQKTVTVRFAEGEKRFIYPEAFESFLSTESAEGRKLVAKDLKGLEQAREAEKQRREQMKEEFQVRLAEEKAQQAALRRKTTTRKPAAKKTAAKKADKTDAIA